MDSKDILMQAALNESPNFISMQGISDWLYNKTGKARQGLLELMEINEADPRNNEYYQAGQYSIKISELRDVMNNVDGDVNKTYNVLNISTGLMEDVSGDDIVDDINNMFQSNEILASGFEVLGSSSEDLTSITSAFEARVTGICGVNAVKTDTYKTIQKTLLDGNGNIKSKTSAMAQLLTVSNSGQDAIQSDFKDYTGATPSAVWSNVVWPTIKSCVSSIAQVTAMALGGIFGIATSACLSIGKALINSYRIAMNPNLINVFNQHPIRGSLNAIHESLTMSTIAYESGVNYGQLKTNLKETFVAFHNSSNFRLNSICCYTIPGGYVLLAISQWTDNNNFVGHISVAPKVSNSSYLRYLSANDYYYYNSQSFLKDDDYIESIQGYLAEDSTGSIDMSQPVEDVKNQVAAGVTGSLLEMLAFSTGYREYAYQGVDFDYGVNVYLNGILKNMSVVVNGQGYGLTRGILNMMNKYKFFYDPDNGWYRSDSSSNPLLSSDLETYWVNTYTQVAPNYSNKDILFLSRCLTPASSASDEVEVTPIDGGNIYYELVGILYYIQDVVNNVSNDYQPHIWLSSQPIGTIGVRSDKVMAAMYFANLTAAITVTALTAITATMAIAFRGAKKKAYVYRGYADNMSWNADPTDKAALKDCWKANRRAIRWEKIAGVYDSVADSTNLAVNSLNDTLAVSQDPAGMTTLGGAVLATLTGNQTTNNTLTETIDPDIKQVIRLIKG